MVSLHAIPTACVSQPNFPEYMMKRSYMCAAADVPITSLSRAPVNHGKLTQLHYHSSVYNTLDYPQNTSVVKGSLHICLDANEVYASRVVPVRERAVTLRASGNIGSPITTVSPSPSQLEASGPNSPSDEIEPFLQGQT